MSTATKLTAAQFEMEERLEPKFMQFNEGDFIEGTLIGIERITVNEKPCSRYTVENAADGLLYSFLGTAQIDTKLRGKDVMHFVQVMCTGTDKNVVKNGNAMKTFTVKVSKTKVGGNIHGVEITDADVNF